MNGKAATDAALTVAGRPRGGCCGLSRQGRRTLAQQLWLEQRLFEAKSVFSAANLFHKQGEPREELQAMRLPGSHLVTPPAQLKVSLLESIIWLHPGKLFWHKHPPWSC